jgi:hypothetical protein
VFDDDRTTNWLGALKDGRIRAVVLPRSEAGVRAGEGIAGMPETIFERYYFLATPANADEIAAGLETESKTPR